LSPIIGGTSFQKKSRGFKIKEVTEGFSLEKREKDNNFCAPLGKGSIPRVSQELGFKPKLYFLSARKVCTKKIFGSGKSPPLTPS